MLPIDSGGALLPQRWALKLLQGTQLGVPPEHHQSHSAQLQKSDRKPFQKVCLPNLPSWLC